MSKRIANISLMHHAYLAGLEAGICSSLNIDNFNYHDDIIYPAMIQAGVQRFRVAGVLPKKIRESDFLSHRVEEGPVDDLFNLQTSIKNSLTNDESDEKSNADLFVLTWFLSELVYSLQTKSSMVSVLKIPKVIDHVEIINPASFSIIKGLLERIETVDINLPVPQLQVSSRDVRVFQEIITSDVFGDYVKSQELLEVSTEEKNFVSGYISDKGKSLYKKFSSSLDLKKATLSLIPITSSMIDAICGKIPGKMADIFGRALSNTLSDNRRITIYNYGDTHLKLLNEYYSAKSKSRLSNEKQP